MALTTPVFNAAQNETSDVVNDLPPVPVRVARGLGLLVERAGEHVLAVIDLAQLDMLSNTANVLAQIYGTETAGEVALGISISEVTGYGFCAVGTVGNELTDAWVEAIELWRGGALPVRLQGRRGRRVATVADEGPEAA